MRWGRLEVFEQSIPSGQIDRIVFREILEGDLLKFIAKSNLTDTGGGARDLRFRSWDDLEWTLRKLFPETETRMGRHEVYVGRFYWTGKDGQEVSKKAVLEPPTNARPNEGRITRVHKYDYFSTFDPPSDSGRLIVLFVQRRDGSVWPRMITEHSLRHEKEWHPEVAAFLLSALDRNRRTHSAAYGFIDFVSGKEFVR